MIYKVPCSVPYRKMNLETLHRLLKACQRQAVRRMGRGDLRTVAAEIIEWFLIAAVLIIAHIIRLM